MSISYLSKSEQQTVTLGKQLSQYLAPGDIVCLFGELGSGKTALTKGIAKGLSIDSPQVHSPTFTLMNIYSSKKATLYHFDLYRIDNPKDLEQIGYEDFFYGNGITVIEWAERLGPLLPKAYLSVKIRHQAETQRAFIISPHGRRYKEFLKDLPK